MKSVIADDPRALYELVRMPAPPPDAAFQPMVQELPAPLPDTDYWFIVAGSDGRKSADVFESKSRHEAGMVKQLVDQTLAAYLRTGMPVRGFLVVMTENRFPAAYQEIPSLEVPGVLSIRYETARLFDTPASVALAYGKPSLLSLVPYMRSTFEERVAAVRRLATAPVEMWRWFWKSVELRYPVDEAERLRKEIVMTEATMERIYQELLPDAPIIKEYEARGIEIGALREARSLLRMALDARFPEVAAPAWIDSLTDLDVLHALARSVMRAAAATEVIAALESAAPRPQ